MNECDNALNECYHPPAIQTFNTGGTPLKLPWFSNLLRVTLLGPGSTSITLKPVCNACLMTTICSTVNVANLQLFVTFVTSHAVCEKIRSGSAAPVARTTYEGQAVQAGPSTTISSSSSRLRQPLYEASFAWFFHPSAVGSLNM